MVCPRANCTIVPLCLPYSYQGRFHIVTCTKDHLQLMERTRDSNLGSLSGSDSCRASSFPPQAERKTIFNVHKVVIHRNQVYLTQARNPN